MKLLLTLINKIKSFTTPKPNITKIAEVDGIRYGYLTDLKIIDDQLQLDLIAYADYCLTQGVPEPGVASSIYELCNDTTTEAVETARRFSSFNTHKPAELNNYFKRYYLPPALAARVLKNIPKSIRKTKFELVLIITNFGTPLHRDVCDNAIILCPIVTNNEVTSFWEIKEEYKNDHTYTMHAFADPDKVEKKLEITFKPGESWLLDVDKIHAVVPDINEPGNRVIITFRWFDNTTISDILKWFQVK